ncbi:MAG: aromatic amino acid transport family protein [Candidatus Nanoarchaeia archaeon]|nr:aromatic amino acid transport family protein [Candidatus Nanoarchaeia archaeon]
MKSKNLVAAVATMIGMIIGAGVLGIPYAVAKSGFLIGAAHIIVLGLALLIINLYVGEISLLTEGRHQLTRYAEKYLGKKGKHLMLAAMAVGIYGALTAYLIGEGASLGELFGINPFIAMIIFFVIISYFIFRDINIIKNAEIFLNAFRFIAIAALLLFVFAAFRFENISYIDRGNLLFPYGIVFFALMGAAAIPEMRDMLKNDKKLLKKAIILGSLIPVCFYLVFSLAFVGAFGANVSEIATSGMSLHKYIAVFGNIFAIISMAAAFLVLGLALKWVFRYDYGVNRHIAFLLACGVPLALVLLGVSGFAKVIAITGAVAGGVEGIIIVLMHRKVKGKAEYNIKSPLVVDILHISLFIAGIIYTFIAL